MISVSKNPATDPTHEGNTERLSGHDGQLCALLESWEGPAKDCRDLASAMFDLALASCERKWEVAVLAKLRSVAVKLWA